MDDSIGFVKRHLELFLFATLSLVVLLWFGGWNYIHQIDSLFYLNPGRRLEDVMYFWKAGETLGISMSEFNLVSFYLLQTGLIGVTSPFLSTWQSLVASQVIIYYFTIFLALVFANLFLKQFYKQILGYPEVGTRDRVLILIVTLFYVINPYTISTVYWRYMTWALFWAAFPLLCYLFLKYLGTSKLRYILISAAVFITPLGAGFPQVGFMNLGLAYVGLFLLWYLRRQAEGKIQLVRFATFAVVFLVLISWVVVPQFLSLSSTSTYTSAPDVFSDLDYLEYSSQYTTLGNILTMAGNYLLYNNVESFPYSWSDAYFSNGALVAALFIFPALAAVAIWFLGSERDVGRKKAILMIAIGYVALPLLMKGVSAPASDLGSFLFSVHSTFFRHPYDRFISLFILLNALLMLYALRNISLHMPDRRHFLGISIVLVLLISVLGYPFFTGEIVNPLDKTDLSKTNYMDLEEAVGNELGDGGRVLVFPFSISGEYSYNISGDINRPNSKSLAYDFLPQASILQFTLSPYDRFALGYIYEVIKNNDSEAFFTFMDHLNVKAFLVQKDYSIEYNKNPYTAIPAQDAIEFINDLATRESLEKIYEDPNVALFKLPLVQTSNMVGGQPALLLGAFSEVPTLSIQKPLVPLTGIWGYDPELFKEYSDLLVSDRSDTTNFLINLMSEKLSISPYELGRLSSEGWEKYPTMDALYSNSTLILESGTSYRDGQQIALWSFGSQSNLTEWTAPLDATATVALSNYVRPGTSGLMMTIPLGTTGTSYLDGPEINVTSNDILWSINWMKTKNAMGSNITVMGYDEVMGEWRMLNYSLPGMSRTNDWREYSFRVLVPENIEKVKLRIIASSPLDFDIGDATTWFDQLSLYSMQNYTTSPFMQMPIDVPETGRYYLLSEVLTSPTGGNLGLQLAGVNSTINTLYPQQKWTWMEQSLYLNKGTYVAQVHSEVGTNSVRTMSLVNETNYIEGRQLVEETLESRNIFISDSAASFFRENATLLSNSSGGKFLLFSDNGTVWTTQSIASEGDYQLSLYGSGSHVLSIDGTPIQLLTSGNGTRVVSTVYMPSGAHNISINGTPGSTLVSLWVFKVVDGTTLDKFLDVHGTSDLTVEKINPTHFRVQVSTVSPFMFCLPESYDSNWKATVFKDGVAVKTISPVALYGCLNGFWIDETGGNLTLEIRYGPQSLLETGLFVSSIALLTVVAIVLIDMRFGKGTLRRTARSMWSKIRRRGP